jgi:hypothetical protein
MGILDSMKMLYKTFLLQNKVFNKLPKYMAELVLWKKCFVSNLKKYLIDKAFY